MYNDLILFVCLCLKELKMFVYIKIFIGMFKVSGIYNFYFKLNVWWIKKCGKNFNRMYFSYKEEWSLNML